MRRNAGDSDDRVLLRAPRLPAAPAGCCDAFIIKSSNRNIQVATLRCAAWSGSSGDNSSRSNWQEISRRSAARTAGTQEWERPLALHPASRFPDGCPSAPERGGDTTKPNELVGVVDPSKGGSTLYRVQWNVGNVIDFALPAGTARASPAMATSQSQPLGLDRPIAFPAARLDSPAGPGKSGVGTSKQTSGATGNTVDRLPPTLARVAGGEVAYAASQVLCAHADRSCASLASATPRTGRADAVGRWFPSWTDVTPSVSRRPQAECRVAMPHDAGSLAGAVPEGRWEGASLCSGRLGSQNRLRLLNTG